MPIVPASPAAIREGAALLANGELVAFPTETVYGLGADAGNGRAVAKIFEAKGRPRFNPLIVHVSDVDAAARLATVTPLAERLMGELWPGPLTLVLERREGAALSDLVSAGLGTIALRMPDHPIARALLTAAGRPIAAPSANRSGRMSATQAKHVAEDLGDSVAMVLDGGATAHGIESTIVGVTGSRPVLLRPGAVAVETIEAIAGARIERVGHDPSAPTASGQLASHYAPRALLRLDATDLRPGEALLAFGVALDAGQAPALNLSPSGDLIEAAANLFAALRVLDRSGVATIAVQPIPEEGLGEAINDRLRRAAAPR